MAETFERPTTSAGEEVDIERLHRYFLARAVCAGSDVLDIAAGEGHGSALLAQTAASVVGVEPDPARVTHAQANYSAGNLRYLEGDTRLIPLPSASVDAAVSLGTIGHLAEQAGFLTEIRRVLRPGGRFIVSLPEGGTSVPPGQTPNPLHADEPSRAGFTALLQTQFAHVALLGQRVIRGSALVGEGGGRASTLVFERRGPTTFEHSAGLRAPTHWVAIASDREGPALPDSLCIDDALTGPSTATAGLAAELARAQTTLAVSERSFRLGEAEFTRLTRDNAAMANELAAMRRSLSWRLTSFLRRGKG